MRRTETFSKQDMGHTYTSVAYTDDGRVWYWDSVNRPCPLDACKSYGIPCVIEAQQAAISAYTDAVLKQYRAQRRGISDEERHEMRAAFGAGSVVVDVITGERTQL